MRQDLRTFERRLICRRFLIVNSLSEQIGTRLREAREEAGLIHEDVFHRVRIPISVIRALEAEDFSVFSSPTYAKSFLSQYSEFLGVDAAPWLDSIEQVTFKCEEVVAPLIGSQPAVKPVVKEAPQRSGAMAAVMLLVVSGILLFAAVQGYQALDARFSAEKEEEKVPEVVALPESDPYVKPVVLVVPAPKAEAVAEDDSEQVPPPRAILVTDS